MDKTSVRSAYVKAMKGGALSLVDTSFCVVDSSVMLRQIDRVRDVFPEEWIHATAIKTNPLFSVLSFFAEQGMALEAATFEEVAMGARTMTASGNLIWDSPVKTLQEYQQVEGFEPTVYANFNSLAEVYRINPTKKTLNGLRINPQINPSAHASMSVGGKLSKFGEPIAHREAIFELFAKDASMVGLHVHTSSQTSNYQSMVDGIRKVVDLALEIEQKTGRSLHYMDIGGGFPVDFTGNQLYDLADFEELLRAQCPELFEHRWQVLTEFGRYYHAHAGVVYSKIEDKVSDASGEVWMIHTGADLLLRECYQVGQWPHRLKVLSASGEERTGDLQTVKIGGPLCFGGDYPFQKVKVTNADLGDYLAILDTGANSWALWSHHCSRSFPKIFMGSSARDFEDLRVIRKRDELTDHLRFWGADQ